MNKLSVFSILIICFLTLCVGSCDTVTDLIGGNTPANPGNPSTPITIPANPEPALRAIPVASFSSTPKELDSYTDGTKNYYLIDVGYIRNIYVSTVAIAHYNGMTPVTSSKTTITTETVTNAVKDTVSSSIMVSDTQNKKVGIEGAWKNQFPGVAEYTVKLKTEWSGSWTNSNTSTKSTETSISSTVSFAESVTTSFTVGENGEPQGYHRYAIYAISDVYFLITTSLDNQQLLSWDTAVCVRNGSYLPHMEFSPDGNFDNSPDDSDITFPEDFYKVLPKPTKDTSPPIVPPSPTYSTDFVMIRTETKKITDSGRFNQPIDVVNLNSFGLNLSTMKQEGYKTISFYIQLNVREIEDGYQYLFLFSSPRESNDYYIAELQFEHSKGSKDSNWWVHYESELYFENVSIDKFTNNEFVIRYGASGVVEDTWENKDLKIKLVFKR
ncbi:MAG: hypothetical protein LBQ94_02535 [Treponema sp.]|jgi:hypothetical protein|nr:hypothetical protein [Treponema sp.]